MSIASVVNLAAGKIGELLVEEAKFLYGVEDQVRSLQEEFTMMQSFLVDMEAMDEEGGDERSRTTIKQIRKIAYDAEDVIESYILEASSSADKKEEFFKRYLCFCSSLLRTHQVGSEIEAITESINKTMERWKKYMGENGVRIDARQGLNEKARARIRPIAYSHTYEEHVVGLDEDINKLVGVLTSDVKVVSIVGMGGSGKTTLARKLYNHECVQKHFDCVAWVSVSQQWVAQQILIDLLRNTSGETMTTDEARSLQVLVEKLHRYLERKRYLIVLDDVWEERALKDILPALPLGSDHGRKIIVTTRNQKVVDYPDVKCFNHEPRRLTEEESWELFRKIALIQREKSNTTLDLLALEELGKEMLKKCEGLPLAVIALAGILVKKETVEEWEKIKKAVSSRIMEDGRGTHLYGPVNEMLALSYNDLPRELKPCFLYLAKFPEDYEIPTGPLIRMWIAEGFISADKQHEGDTLEDVAQAYLDELIHRCVVQIANKNYQGKVKRIRIHDLVRDLGIKKAKEEDFLEIFSSKSPSSNTIVTKSRRAAISSCDRMYIPFPTKSQHLRSLAYKGQLPSQEEEEEEQSLSLQPIQENFRLLRVLILESIQSCDRTLPAGIGSLIHLRYLGLWDTNITELPSSIGNLPNLLTLDYRNYRYSSEEVIRIPDVVWKIESLRHIYLPELATIKETLKKFHTLKYLQTLKGIQGGSWMLKELPLLSPSVEKLSIKDIGSREQLEAAFQCPSIRLDCLYSLELHWDNGKLENLEPIIHCQHLRKLILFGRMGNGLGREIQFPTNINELVLRDTGFEAKATLVALGKLPQLTSLHLLDSSYKGIWWSISAGEFPQLKQLVLVRVPNLEEWSIEREAMPQFKILGIYNCEKLKRLPEGLKFMTTLQEVYLYGMLDEFYKRIRGEDGNRGGEDAHIIQHVPLVQFGGAPIRTTSLRASTRVAIQGRGGGGG